MDVTYNNGLKAASMKLNEIATPTNETFDKTYDYYADGRLKKVDESITWIQDKFDRLFSYDHQGRVKDAKSGIEANGQTEVNLDQLPYRQSYTFSAFDNIISRDSTIWDYAGWWGFNYSTTNNRVQYHSYDNDGRETQDINLIQFKYDASGQMEKTFRINRYETLLYRDGDGNEVKRSQRTWDDQTYEYGEWAPNYFIVSSVLGRIVTEIGETGKKKVTYVIAAGGLIAKQSVNETDQEGVAWKHTDASGLSSRSSGVGFGGSGFAYEELDALGNNVGHVYRSNPVDRGISSSSSGSGFVFEGTDWGDCELDGIMTPCSMVDRVSRSGALGLSVRRWNEHTREFDYQMIDLSSYQNLPGGRYSSVWIPDELGNAVADDGRVGETEETEFHDWTSIGGVQGQWFTFYFDDPVLNPKDAHVVIFAGRRALNEPNNNCAKALDRAGLLDTMKKALESFQPEQFLSVTQDGSKLARPFFGMRVGVSETVGGYYNRLFGNATNKGTASEKAILAYDGVYSFAKLAGSASKTGNEVYLGFFLHEFAHYATGRSDEQLVSLLVGAPFDPGDESMNASDRLSKFFNSDCATHLGKAPPPPKRR